MKTLSLVSYIIGSILLIISCFTTGLTVTWILGGVAVICLIMGCVFQFNDTKRKQQAARHHRTQS